MPKSRLGIQGEFVTREEEQDHGGGGRDPLRTPITQFTLGHVWEVFFGGGGSQFQALNEELHKRSALPADVVKLIDSIPKDGEDGECATLL